MARSFNGSSDQIITSAFNIPLQGTLSIWVNAGSLSNAYNGIIGQSGGGSFFIIFLKSTGKFAYYVSGAGNGAVDPGTASASGWMHVAMSFSVATPGMFTYVNGVSDGTATILTSPSVVSTGLGFGFDNGNAGRNFPGSLADGAEWNVALSAAEIAALAKGARPNVIRPQSLVSWLDFQGYGHPALDRSIYNRNGTITGTSFVVGPPLLSAAPIMLTTVNSGEAFLKRSPLMVAPTLPKPKVAAAASSVVFRKTLSQIGGRVGSRQIQGWAN